MYRAEENNIIGEYIGKLIARKYCADRQFAIAYIKLRDGIEDEPASDEIQRVANKICQMKKGGKGIQINDLPLLSELLEVSVDSILSAGKVAKPAPARTTNYSVAFSEDKEVWKEYIERPDKLILNEDEYGKTVIDYAVEFGNYGFLRYLIDKNYIFLIDEDQQKYWGSFGSGTRIERRQPFNYDLLEYRMKEKDSLRTNIIALALENKDYKVLDEAKAREIPSLYEASYFYSRSLEIQKYYNPQMMKQIVASSDEVLVYFSTEFEIETNRKALCRLTFPYLGRLIDMAVKADRKATASMLKNALKHNQEVLKTIRKIGKVTENSFFDIRQYMDEKAIMEEILQDFHFYEENDTVCFHSGVNSAGNFLGIFSNVIHVNASSKDKYIKSLIEDVNHSYNQVKNFNCKGMCRSFMDLDSGEVHMISS